MSVFSTEHTAEGNVCCPTCKAKQEWSDTCRRCKCDLALLRSAAEASEQIRRRCLLRLRAGRTFDALHLARRLYGLSPDARSARLLAVCHLARRNWAAARAMAVHAQSGEWEVGSGE